MLRGETGGDTRGDELELVAWFAGCATLLGCNLSRGEERGENRDVALDNRVWRRGDAVEGVLLVRDIVAVSLVLLGGVEGGPEEVIVFEARNEVSSSCSGAASRQSTTFSMSPLAST